VAESVSIGVAPLSRQNLNWKHNDYNTPIRKIEKTKSPAREQAILFLVEMAGIEPASEKFASEYLQA
jgi:hypothetical protein